MLLEKMLIGEIGVSDFIKTAQENEEVMKSILNLIPQDAVKNPTHPIWNHISYSWALESNFNVWNGLCRVCKFNDTFGDRLNIWGTLRHLYLHDHPDLPYTTKYEDEFSLSLNATRDCYEGPEVQNVVEKIIETALQYKGKTKQIQVAKEEIKKVFHVVDNKYPRWIQGGEWPMGVHSPMQFIERKRVGSEEVWFIFQDVDTKEFRTIVQYY